MATHHDYAVMAGVITVSGVTLAAVAAVKPFFDDGYHLHFGILLAGLLPYLAYAIIAVLMPRPVTILAGVLVLAVQAWLVLAERFSGSLNDSGGAIYYVPLLLTLALIPWWTMAMRQPWRRQGGVASDDSSGS